MSLWLVPKAMACLKLIVHPEHLSLIFDQNLDELEDSIMMENKENLLDIVKVMYNKSNGLLKIYGTPEEMFENFEKLINIPELIESSLYEDSGPQDVLHLPPHVSIYSDISDDFHFTSRKECIFEMVKLCNNSLLLVDTKSMVHRFYRNWLIVYLGKALQGMKGTYDLIPADLYEVVVSELKELIENLNKENQMNSTNQDVYKKTYAEIVYIIEQSQAIFEQNAKLFTPFSKLPLTDLAQPVIRRLKNSRFDFFLTKEVDSALKLILKTQFPGRELPEDLNILETKYDRRLGMVYGITPRIFEQLLEKLQLFPDLFIILEVPIAEDERAIPFPIISAYGTHCLPAIDAFEKVLYYVTNILRIFQRSSQKNKRVVFVKISCVLYSLFVEKPVFYLIELWKINEVIDAIRRELSEFLTEPIDDSSPKETYTRDEVIDEFNELIESYGVDRCIFTEKIVSLVNEDPDDSKTVKLLYDGCAQIARIYFSNYGNEIWDFESSQELFERKRRVTHFSLGFEPDFVSPETSLSSSKSGNQVAKLEKELENLKIDTNQLKTEIDLLKSVTENSEKEIQKLREDSEELKQKNDILLSENGILKAENFKLAEIQQTIKNHRTDLRNKHNELVDNAWSSIHRLCSKHPDVEEARNDVKKLEDCLDEYVKNVEKECKKLRE